MSGLGIDGLVSGLDTSGIITELLKLRQKPIDGVKARIEKTQDRADALKELNTRALALQEVVKRLRLPSGFTRAQAVSSNPALLRATGDIATQLGTFSFVGKQVAAASQFVSQGFPDPDRATVAPQGGHVTIELGDARLSRPVDLAAIHGGAGFARGKIRIVDDGGRSAIVDLTAAVTLRDVVDAINANGAAQVEASIEGDGLILRNLSQAGSLSITEVGGGTTAASLGIAGSGVGGTLTGQSINRLNAQTSLATLNDGRGVLPGQDLGVLTIQGSTTFVANINGARTIGEILDRINMAGAGTLTAALTQDGKGIRLVDAGTPAALTVTGAAAADLGLSADTLAPTGGAFEGRALVPSLGSVLGSSIRGVNGGGLGATVQTPATFSLTDGQGQQTLVTLNGREDLREILARLSGGAAQVKATINAAGTGIEILDVSGGSGALNITDLTGAAAAALGVAGSHALGRAAGANVNFQHFHAGRALSSLLGGEGVQSGEMRVRLRNGSEAAIRTAGARSVGDILARLNAVPGLTAAINATGDGIQLTDTTGGSGTLAIEDLSGNAARALNLAGVFSGASVDRSFEFRVQVTAGATLNAVMTEIVRVGVPVNVATFGDGSASSPARLSITGKFQGSDAALTLSSDFMSFTQTSEARDALLLMGENSPQVLRSRNGTFSVIPGLTLDLLGVGPAHVTVSRDTTATASDIKMLVERFNDLTAKVREFTAFDKQSLTTGRLHGDATAITLAATLKRLLLDPVAGIDSTMNNAAALGRSIDRSGALTLDEGRLQNALSQRFEQVAELFSHSARLKDSTALSHFHEGQGLRRAAGPDLRVRFRNGTSLDLDLSGAQNVRELLVLLNADSRLSATVGADGRSFSFTDNTSGNQPFALSDLNQSGTTQSLGFLQPQAGNGAAMLQGGTIVLAEEQGLARRLDREIERYVNSLDGVFRQRREESDKRVEAYNADIARMGRGVNMERERLMRQFQTLEKFLAKSQQLQTQLAGQLKALTPPK